MFFLLLAGCLVPARGQFGGYDPPAPICPAFSCPAGQKAVGNPDHQIWSYGCKDAGMNVFNMASFDPNDPLGGMRAGQKNLDKCCVERDICKQTCGMTSKACHDSFKKCSNKICKGDQNCQLQAMMSDILSEPYDDKKDETEKYDPEATKCKGFKRGQSEACKCVPKKEWQSATETHLKAFYGKFNKEKLTKKGEIKDVDEVWKKWKGKEPEMFLALAAKYKDKAVEIRQKPKPPPYKPPKDDGGSSFSDEAEAEASADAANEEAAEPEAPAPAPASGLDDEDRAFEEKRQSLQDRKAKAAEDEDYDLADKIKGEAAQLLEDEVKRLKAKKAQSIADEEYAEAKRIKQRLAKLEL